jgi:hypothetical protein
MKSLLEKIKMEEGITHVTFSGPKNRYEKVERFPIEDVLSNKDFLANAVNGEKKTWVSAESCGRRVLRRFLGQICV